MPDLSYEEAKRLLEKHLKDKGNAFLHSKAVSEYVYEISIKVKKKHPELDVNPEKMRIAGLLHDIGKDMGKSYLHAINGAKFLRKLGYPEIAEIIEKHTFAKEFAEFENLSGDFEPKTIEEKLLTYADAHVLFKPMPFEERMKDLKERHGKTNPKILELVERGIIRIRKILREIDKLMGE